MSSVFNSYSHDPMDPTHSERVAGLAASLLEGGFDVFFDQLTISLGSPPVVSLKVEDYYPSKKRFLLRFKEKGGKEKELPGHHKLEEVLDQYLKTSGLEKEPGSP